jgi:hypothetical protein
LPYRAELRKALAQGQTKSLAEEADMKDVLSIAAFAINVLGLVVFVNILKPDGIRTAQAPSRAEHCEKAHSQAQTCGSSAVTAVFWNGIGRCHAKPEDHWLPKQESC